MYLEISGRRTHKTNRLLTEMESWLVNPTHYAVLITPRGSYSKELAEQTNPRSHPRLVAGTEIQPILEKLKSVAYMPNVRWFWDEFDSCDIRNVPVMETGYYTTTPVKVRKLIDWGRWQSDKLLRLIVANEFMYTTHHGMNYFFGKEGMDIEEVQRMKKNLGFARFNAEFFCEFQDSFDENRDIPPPKSPKHMIRLMNGGMDHGV